MTMEGVAFTRRKGKQYFRMKDTQTHEDHRCQVIILGCIIP